MSLKIVFLLLALAGAVGIALGYFLRMVILLGQRGSMEIQIRKMMLDAEEKAKKVIEDAERRGEEKVRELTQEYSERARDLKSTEERLVRREELLDKRQGNLDEEAANLARKAEDLERAQADADRVIAEQQAKLEKIAELTKDQAKHELMQSIEKQYENDIEGRMRKLEISSNEKLEQRAREILTTSVHRLGNSVVSDVLATTIQCSCLT